MPTYITCSVSPCDISISLSSPVMDLTTADGAVIAGAIIAVWAVAWAFRMLIRFLNSEGDKSPEGE